MTVQELAKSIAHQQGEGWADPDVATAFEEWVNEGVEELVAAASWPSLSLTVPISVISGTAQYDLPATMGGISAVFDPATGRKLHYRPRDEQAMLELDPDMPGEPTHWAYGPADEATGLRSVLLWPVPSADGQLSVLGERAATFTLAATDAIPLPPEFIRVLRNFVRAQYRENSGDEKGAGMAWARYTTGLAQLVNKYVDTPARESRLQPRDVPRVDAFGVPRIPNTI